jgi:hypothetical protein
MQSKPVIVNSLALIPFIRVTYLPSMYVCNQSLSTYIVIVLVSVPVSVPDVVIFTPSPATKLTAPLRPFIDNVV